MTVMACNKSIMTILRRIVFAASVYYIWNERNKRLFGNEKRSQNEVLLTIINNIRMKLASLKVKNSTKAAKLLLEAEMVRREGNVVKSLYVRSVWGYNEHSGGGGVVAFSIDILDCCGGVVAVSMVVWCFELRWVECVKEQGCSGGDGIGVGERGGNGGEELVVGVAVKRLKKMCVWIDV
ncbi:hypothetical protein Tco_0810843 [Tanacetum coccineum]